MKLHICIIGPAQNVHVQRWAAGLAGRGHAVSIVSPTPEGVVVPSVLRNVPVYRFPIAQAGTSRAARIVALWRGWARVPGLLRALKPDLVHLHSLPTPAAVPFLMRLPRMVVSAWGSDVVRRDPRKARMYPMLLARAAAVTATSHYLADVTAGYLSHPRSIDVVPFGIDVDQFTPAENPQVAPHIGTVRHLEPPYGIDILLDALPRITVSIENIRCSIAGDGKEIGKLQARGAELGLADTVTWRGRIDHATAPAFLRTLAVFANPSRAESFGVAALEAQACGVPVVASDVGGLPEVVKDGVTGLLVPPEDPSALAEALIALLRDPARRAAMGAAGVAWVSERYSWSSSLDGMQAVYDRVLSSAGQSRV